VGANSKSRTASEKTGKAKEDKKESGARVGGEPAAGASRSSGSERPRRVGRNG